MPEGLSFEEAAALPLAALTAHQSLDRLGLRGGETLFVTGGAGGVGHLAIQLAHARGARVIASGSPGSHDFIRSLGAEPVDYHDDVAEQVRALTDGGGADAVFDLFGDARLRRAAPGRPPGLDRERRPRSASTARPATSSCGPRATTSASTSRRSSTRAACARTSRRTFALEDAAAAHERLEGGHVRGKLVLTISD